MGMRETFSYQYTGQQRPQPPRTFGQVNLLSHPVPRRLSPLSAEAIPCSLKASVTLLELADTVLFLDAEQLAAALVGTHIVQFDHFPLAVECTSSPLLECLLEDRTTVCAPQI